MKAAATTQVAWRGRRVAATVPHLLAKQTFELRPAVDASCKSAASRLVLTAEVVPPDFATLAHLMARNEALASSFIEGIGAPTLDLVLPGPSPVAQSLNDAIATVHHVRDEANTDVSVEVLCDWHARVMRSTNLPHEHRGRLRTEQGWIGGTSPLDAALVTPPATKIPALVDDLIDFVNRPDLDPILQAAITHAQFELIHPFADGNGRVGRML
ncbi:MAG: Fic family protein, partial [Actinomycetota bacterium]